jgi:hypothetical protein
VLAHVPLCSVFFGGRGETKARASPGPLNKDALRNADDQKQRLALLATAARTANSIGYPKVSGPIAIAQYKRVSVALMAGLFAVAPCRQGRDIYVSDIGSPRLVSLCGSTCNAKAGLAQAGQPTKAERRASCMVERGG